MQVARSLRLMHLSALLDLLDRVERPLWRNEGSTKGIEQR